MDIKRKAQSDIIILPYVRHLDPSNIINKFIVISDRILSNDEKAIIENIASPLFTIDYEIYIEPKFDPEVDQEGVLL